MKVVASVLVSFLVISSVTEARAGGGLAKAGIIAGSVVGGLIGLSLIGSHNYQRREETLRDALTVRAQLAREQMALTERLGGKTAEAVDGDAIAYGATENDGSLVVPSRRWSGFARYRGYYGGRGRYVPVATREEALMPPAHCTRVRTPRGGEVLYCPVEAAEY